MSSMAQSDAAILEDLGSRIRQARIDRGLSQEALAEETGLHRVTLSRIERGQVAVPVTTLIRILRALGLPDSLDQMFPAPSPSPLDRMRREGRQQRQRVGQPRSNRTEESGKPWRWGDEEEDEAR